MIVAHRGVVTLAVGESSPSAATQNPTSLVPELVGATLLDSLDGKRAAEYSRWKGPDELAAVAGRVDPGALPLTAHGPLEAFEVVYVNTADTAPGASAEADPQAPAAGVTMVCVFTVAEGKQDALLDLLRSEHESGMENIPGFVSVSFHRGAGGRRVFEYLQFQTVEQFQAITETPQGKEHLRLVGELATWEMGLYRVSGVIGGTSTT